MNDYMDMSKILSILTKMDKKDLEKGISLAKQILETKEENNKKNE